jgi:hypothetical protein
MAGPPADDGPAPDLGRYGEPIPGGGASFRCAACGEVAATVRLLRAGEPASMGPPLGEQDYSRDGIVIDYWLGSTCWMAADPGSWQRVSDVLAADRAAPAALHAINWELAPFFCRHCGKCYCRDDWHPIAVWDGPFYDYTEGECPAGHRQMIDD